MYARLVALAVAFEARAKPAGDGAGFAASKVAELTPLAFLTIKLFVLLCRSRQISCEEQIPFIAAFCSIVCSPSCVENHSTQEKTETLSLRC